MFGYSAAKLLAAVQIPLQATLITYAGAAGLAGVALVTGVMVTPAREVVQEAIQPVGEFVQSIMPSTGPPGAASRWGAPRPPPRPWLPQSTSRRGTSLSRRPPRLNRR